LGTGEQLKKTTEGEGGKKERSPTGGEKSEEGKGVEAPERFAKESKKTGGVLYKSIPAGKGPGGGLRMGKRPGHSGENRTDVLGVEKEVGGPGGEKKKSLGNGGPGKVQFQSK